MPDLLDLDALNKFLADVQTALVETYVTRVASAHMTTLETVISELRASRTRIQELEAALESRDELPWTH